MKQLTIISLTLLIALLSSGCSSSVEVTPSQNKTLNNISKSNASRKKDGAMQRALDSWLKKDWTPTVSQDKEIQKKYMEKKKEEKSNTLAEKTKESQFIDKKNKNFTIQEYIDKAAAYMKAKPNDYNNSNVKKLNSLPVIGE